MKKILLFASVVAAMASCAKTEVSDINTDSPSVISFSTPYVSSKASDATTATVTVNGSTVAVFANVTGENEFAKFMDDVLTSDGSAFSVGDGPYYWPSSGTLDFYAYYPIVDSQTQTNGVVPVTIATTAAGQTDVLAAATTKADKGTTGEVSLDLKHMLSKVDFKFTIEAGIEFNLKSFKLIGVEGATDGLDLTTSAMKVPSTAVSTSYTYSDSEAFASVKSVEYGATTNTAFTLSSLDNTGAFMLLPQTLVAPSVESNVLSTTNGAYIQIEYTMSYDKGVSYIVGDDKTTYATANIPMPATTLDAGKSYVYSLSVKKDGFNGGYDAEGKELIDAESTISFTVSVSGWDTTNETTPLTL